MVKIVSINELLSMNLIVPNYQRPYKWTYKNMVDLLSDIDEAIIDSKKYDDFKYRIGTIILNKEIVNDKEQYNIVDGQQRIISLAILMLCLQNDYSCPLLENTKFKSSISKANIHNNFITARDYILKTPQFAIDLKEALSKTIEVVLMIVDNVNEAFQLFDSQNTRGRALDPHDLLKAYHLREMSEYPHEMKTAVTKWEAVNSKEIRDLFNLYLFPIKNWSSGKDSYSFTTKDIDCYKGISENSPYTYAKRANNAMPFFQITEPFLAGKSFFDMVSHYLEVLSYIKEEIDSNINLIEIKNIIDQERKPKNRHEFKSAGFSYATNLFYCALLCYYDKFRNFDERAIKKLFTWAFMLRVDLENLGYESINKYALGREGKYTNSIKMFSVIKEARLHSEISNIPLRVLRTNGACAPKWNDLYAKLKEMNGLGGSNNE